MKKILIISAFLGIGLSAFSQLKYFLPDSNAYFSVSPYKFWFEGDTAIGIHKYKKVFQQKGDSLGDFKKAIYYAALREDTIAEKIFCIQKDDGVERLISDFSLNAGDTVSVYSFWPFGTPNKILVKAKNTDSVLINNQLRKSVIIDVYIPRYSESWIEGIGSTFGLFFPSAYGYADLGIPELLCINVNDTIIYQKYDKCYKDLLTGIKKKNNDFIRIYPTIVKNTLVIEVQQNSSFQFQYNLFNTNGIIVKYGLLKNNFLDVSDIKEGLYLIILHDTKSSKTFINKFIKL